jgi:hypothetical protein
MLSWSERRRSHGILIVLLGFRRILILNLEEVLCLCSNWSYRYDLVCSAMIRDCC